MNPAVPKPSLHTSGDGVPVGVAHAYPPDAETDQDNLVSRVAMTLRVETEADWRACRAEVSRIVDQGDAATELDVDMALRIAIAMEEFDHRDTRAVGGQEAMIVAGPRSKTDRALLQSVIARTRHVTKEQARRLRMIADGIGPDTVASQ